MAWPGTPGFGLCRAFFCLSLTLLSALSPTSLSAPPGPYSHLVCLAQGRLSEEIEKLRQEVDQLKGQGGPFVDGIHSRYWSMGDWACWDGSWVDPEERDFLPPKDRLGPQGSPPFQGGH